MNGLLAQNDYKWCATATDALNGLQNTVGVVFATLIVGTFLGWLFGGRRSR